MAMAGFQGAMSRLISSLSRESAPNSPEASRMPPAAYGAPANAASQAAAAAGEGDEVEEFVDAEDVQYTSYRPSKVKIGLDHPDPVVENATLATVEPPDVTYELHLPQKVVDKGMLSCVQLESVIYACQRHELFLPGTPLKAGFMLGDGAGVGKGRQLAGMVFENWLCGRRKHVWVSVSADLKEDSERDLRDIKADIPCYKLTDFGYEKLGNRIDEGVLFVTYSSLINKNSSKKRRLDQVVEFLGGKSFEGCILFDECHKAKNLYAPTGATQTGKAVEELQAVLPNARVVYCSATSVTEPRNMGYMTRLGLWGPETAYPSFMDFQHAISHRGIGAMEMVAMHLKHEGAMLCRTLSYQGATFDLVEDGMSEEAERAYNAAAKVWQDVHKLLEEAIKDGSLETLKPAKAPKTRRGAAAAAAAAAALQELDDLVADDDDDDEDIELDNVGGIVVKKLTATVMRTLLWSAHQRFFKSVCMGLKVPTALRLAHEALKDGKSVVLGLQSTGESNTVEAVKRGDVGDEFLSAPKETLKRLIIKLFWTAEAYKNGDLSDDGSEISLSSIKGGVLAALKGPRAAKAAKKSYIDDSDEDSASVNLSTEESESEASLEESEEETDSDDGDGESGACDEDSGADDFVKPAKKSSSRGSASGSSSKNDKSKKVKKQHVSAAASRARTTRAKKAAAVKAEKQQQQQEEERASGSGGSGSSGGGKLQRLRKNRKNAGDGGGGGSSGSEFGDVDGSSGGEETAKKARKAAGSKARRAVVADHDSSGTDTDPGFPVATRKSPEATAASRSSPNANGGRSGSEDVSLSTSPESDVKRVKTENGYFSVKAASPAVTEIADAAVEAPSPMETDSETPAVRKRQREQLQSNSSKVKAELTATTPAAAAAAGAPNGAAAAATPRVKAEKMDVSSADEAPSSSSNAASKKVKPEPAASVLKKHAEEDDNDSVIDLTAEEPEPVPAPSPMPARAASDSDSESITFSDHNVAAAAAASSNEEKDEKRDVKPSKNKKGNGTFSAAFGDESDKGCYERVQARKRVLTLAELKRARLEILLEMVEALSLAPNPLDQLVEELGGVDEVAELTGRKARMVRDPKTGKVRFRSRTDDNDESQARQNIYEKELFMSGKKLVAIISEAASAGISLQADKRVENQRRRVHITLELPWSADKAIQQLGRSHRANQASAPEFKLLISAVGGERRFASAVAKRLESLGALTQGDRRASHAGSKSFGFQLFNVDNRSGKDSLNHIYRLCVNEREPPIVAPPTLPDEEYEAIKDRLLDNRQARLTRAYMEKHMTNDVTDGKATFFEAAAVWLHQVGINTSDILDGKEGRKILGEVGRFLNRLLGMEIEHQNLLFSYFSQVVEAKVRDDKRMGRYDDGIRMLRGNNVTLQNTRPLNVNVQGVKAGEVQAHEVVVDKAMTWEEALQKHDEALEQAEHANKLSEERQRATSHTARSKYRQRQRPNLTGFWLTDVIRGTRFCVLAVDTPTANSSFVGDTASVVIFRPYSGRGSLPRDKLSGNSSYKKISLKEAELKWKREMDDVERADFRHRKERVITGSILPIWATLEEGMNHAGFHKSRAIVTIVQLSSKEEGENEHVQMVDVDGGSSSSGGGSGGGSSGGGGGVLASVREGKPFLAVQLPSEGKDYMYDQLYDFLESEERRQVVSVAPKDKRSNGKSPAASRASKPTNRFAAALPYNRFAAAPANAGGGGSSSGYPQISNGAALNALMTMVPRLPAGGGGGDPAAAADRIAAVQARIAAAAAERRQRKNARAAERRRERRLEANARAVQMMAAIAAQRRAAAAAAVAAQQQPH